MVGARYDFYNPDADSTNQVMGAQVPTALSYQTLSITAALRGPSGRLIAEFDINRNHNGRDLAGQPDQPRGQRVHHPRRGELLMRAHATTLALVLAAAGCGGASPETGITANLRLTTAQFVPGPLDADTAATGPTVFVNLGVAKVSPGAQNLPLSGNVQAGPASSSAWRTTCGHWIVPAPLVKDRRPRSTAIQFSTRMSFSPELPPGPEKLIVRGVAADGNDRTVPAVRADGRRACPDRRAGLLARPGTPTPTWTCTSVVPNTERRSGHRAPRRADRDLVA